MANLIISSCKFPVKAWHVKLRSCRGSPSRRCLRYSGESVLADRPEWAALDAAASKALRTTSIVITHGWMVDAPLAEADGDPLRRPKTPVSWSSLEHGRPTPV